MEMIIVCLILLFFAYIVMKSTAEPDSGPVTKHTKCPACGGTRFHAFVDNVVIDPGKVKSKTTLNMNPLKPFTVFNHKEKVVRQPVIKQVSKFVCDDCGKIFQ